MLRAFLIVFVVVMAVAFRGEVGAADSAPANRMVAIPLANPLKGFDASTIAWNSAAQIFDASTQSVATALNCDLPPLNSSTRSFGPETLLARCLEPLASDS